MNKIIDMLVEDCPIKSLALRKDGGINIMTIKERGSGYIIFIDDMTIDGNKNLEKTQKLFDGYLKQLISGGYEVIVEIHKELLFTE